LMRIPIAALGLLLGSAGHAGETISYECNAAHSWARVGNLRLPEATPRDEGAVPAQVNWRSLLEVDEKNLVYGEPRPISSRDAARRCGRLTLRFSAGFLNPASGDAPFPVVEILLGKLQLVPPTAMQSCVIDVMKYDSFGRCPDAWAESITAQWNAKSQKVNVSVIRDFQHTPESDNTRQVDSLLLP
jgi:hypothetical protein